MKEFQLRNDTQLFLRNDPINDLKEFCFKKNVLFVYGNGSIKKNGCYYDVKTAIMQSGGNLFELGGTSGEFEQIEKGIKISKENSIDLIIGAGGASIMDCAKLIAFGIYHQDDLWEYIKMHKNPYGQKNFHLFLYQLILQADQNID